MAWKMFAWELETGSIMTAGMWATDLGRKPPNKWPENGQKWAGKSPGHDRVGSGRTVAGRVTRLQLEDAVTSA